MKLGGSGYAADGKDLQLRARSANMLSCSVSAYSHSAVTARREGSHLFPHDLSRTSQLCVPPLLYLVRLLPRRQQSLYFARVLAEERLVGPCL